MPQQSNNISVDMVLDMKDFEDNLKKSETLARDTGKKLSQELVLKMRLNIDDITQKIAKAKSDLKGLDQSSVEAQKLRLDISQYSNQLTEAKRRLNNYLNTGDEGLSRLQKKFNQISDKMGGSATISGRVFSGISDGIGSATQMAAGFVSQLGLMAVALGAIKIGAEALALGDKLEQSTISFTTMLGSAEAAKNMLEDLAIFASNTPFELIGLRDTAKQLLAFGIDADQIIPTLKALGDVSAGLSVPIQQVAYAFGQVKVAGRLMGGELMQFTNAGVPLIAELSKNLGVAQSDIKAMVSEGKISFADVQQAFKTMSGEGGKFANLMGKQTETLSGKWSNFKDNVSMILEDLGTALLPAAKLVVDAGNFALSGLRKIFSGFHILFELTIGGMVETSFWLQSAWAKISGNIAILLNGVAGTFKDLSANTGILVDNMGAAFGALAPNIKQWLNKGIVVVENFLNKASDGINAFAKKLGMESDVVGRVKLGTLDVDSGSSVKFKEFVNTNSKAAAEMNANILSSMESSVQGIKKMQDEHRFALQAKLENIATESSATKKLNTELADLTDKSNSKSINSLDNLQAKLKSLKDTLGKTEIGSKAFNDIKKQIEATQKAIDDAEGKTSKKKTKSAEDLAKQAKALEEKAAREREAAAVAEIEANAGRRIAEVKASAKSEYEKAKLIIKINEDAQLAITKLKDANKGELEIARDIVKAEEEKNAKIREGQELVQSYYGKVVEGASAANDKIVETQKEIDELNKKISESTEEKNKDVAERRLEILEREKEIRQEIARLKSEGVDIELANTLSDKMLSELSPDTKVGTVSVSDLQKVKELNAELAKLQEETVKNSAALDQKTFDDLQAYKALSKTEQILKDYEAEKAVNDKALSDLQKRLETEQLEYSRIDAVKRLIETNFTSFLKTETAARLTELDKLKQAAIETAAALASAGIKNVNAVPTDVKSSGGSTTTTVNQTNNFSAKVTKDDVKIIANEISKSVANAGTGIK